jgi:hypothetical protein
MLLKKKILPALLACSLGVSSYVALPGGPALAAGAGEEEPGELAREGMERMLRAIELMIEMIPQYELPEVMENGDIIIRRKNPPTEDDEEEPEVDETRT